MAKTMAYIEDHQVMNLLWCDDSTPQTDTMIDVGATPAGIGDTWDGGRFYRNGKLVLTDMEQLSIIAAERDNLLKYIEEEEFTTDENGNRYHREVGTDGEYHLVLIESYTGELYQ